MLQTLGPLVGAAPKSPNPLSGMPVALPEGRSQQWSGTLLLPLKRP